jgi:DNA mismatch repair ATPase MutS
MLIQPSIDINELNKRYNLIETILSNNHMENIGKILNSIYDLDKLIRKLEINIINPFELYYIYQSFIQIIKLTDYLTNHNIIKDFDIKDITLVNSFIKLIEKNIILISLKH